MVILDLCTFCKHNKGASDDRIVCTAFQDGRPYDFEASTKLDCGAGVRFDPKEELIQYCDESFYAHFS